MIKSIAHTMAEPIEASTPISLGKKVTLAGLAAAALSPVALPFTEWAQSNPWLALPLVAVWELVLLVTSFSLDVWAKVRPGLVGRAAEAVKFWIDCLISAHRKQYLQDVIFQHRNFDVKGLSTQATFTLELEQVFVDLSVAPIAPHEASADMIRKLPLQLREGRHQVWDYLEGAGGPAKLVLLGAPGSGKTTLIKHIALTFAHGRSPKPDLAASRNLPILLFLREHAEAITKDSNAKLSELVAEYQRDRRRRDIPVTWFDFQLKRERCLVMLDGLDEVADPEMRKKVARWADEQMSIHAGNRFIITSRPYGYRDNPLSGVNVLDVRPFTSEQVSDFVHRWYVANEIKAQQRDDLGVRHDARTGARNLLDRVREAPALSDLAANPLLLTMIATVHRYRSSLPGRRVELYAEICEVSLGKRQQSKGIQLDLTPAQKQRVLEPLAWAMMVARKREVTVAEACAAIKETLQRVNQGIAPSDFLVSIENDSSLLLEKEAGGIYAFAHLTFQEFLGACHAHQGDGRVHVLIRNVNDGWWTECIRLFAATGDATPILRACIKSRPLDPNALALALQCLEEAERKEPAIETELERIVEIGLNEADPVTRKPIAEALLKVRLARMYPLDEDRSIDPGLVSHAEYQLFLDERRAKGEDRRPIHWTTDRFPEGEGSKPVLGLSFQDAVDFCNWLTERAGGQHHFRLPSTVEIATAAPKCATGEPLAAWSLVSIFKEGRGGDQGNVAGWIRVPAKWPEPFDIRQRIIAFGYEHEAEKPVFRDFDDYWTPSTHDLARARTLALIRARDLDRTVANSHLQFPYLTDALAETGTFARHLARVPRASAFARVLNLPLYLDLDLRNELAGARKAARAFGLARGGGLHKRFLAEKLAHALARALGSDLAPSLLLILLLTKSEVTNDDYDNEDEIAEFIPARNRGFAVIALLWTLDIRRWSTWSSTLRRLLQPKLFTDLPSLLIDRLERAIWDLHIAARLARARIDGNDPPFEALRIVRERAGGGNPPIE